MLNDELSVRNLGWSREKILVGEREGSDAPPQVTRAGEGDRAEGC